MNWELERLLWELSQCGDDSEKYDVEQDLQDLEVTGGEAL